MAYKSTLIKDSNKSALSWNTNGGVDRQQMWTNMSFQYFYQKHVVFHPEHFKVKATKMNKLNKSFSRLVRLPSHYTQSLNYDLFFCTLRIHSVFS